MSETDPSASTARFAVIESIPPWYTIADLRWFFSEYTHIFVTFHYNYRLQRFPCEATEIEETSVLCTSVASTSNVECSEFHSEDEPCCVLVELKSEECLETLISTFDGVPWLDGEENAIAGWNCVVKRVVHKNPKDREVEIHTGDLTKPPYIEELVKVNPFPNGNVATSKELLLDFVAVGRIDPETAEELGILDGDDGQDAQVYFQLSEFANTLAEIRGDYEIALVCNIPHTFRSRDLRAFFEDFIEHGGFLMFHYNHRAMNPADPKTGCICAVKLTSGNLEMLLEHYHDQHFVDQEGNEMEAVCHIRKPSEQDLAGSKVSKELSSPLFPRGNVGTPFCHVWALWEEGRFSAPVAKRMGIIPDNESIPEDVQYETLPDGSLKKLMRKRTKPSTEASMQQAGVSSKSTKFAEFEKHTSGFGRKLMEKLGWTEGRGLGKDQAGIYDPVAIEMNKSKTTAKRGLGAKKIKCKSNLPYGIHALKD